MYLCSVFCNVYFNVYNFLTRICIECRQLFPIFLTRSGDGYLPRSTERPFQREDGVLLTRFPMPDHTSRNKKSSVLHVCRFLCVTRMPFSSNHEVLPRPQPRPTGKWFPLPNTLSPHLCFSFSPNYPEAVARAASAVLFHFLVPDPCTSGDPPRSALLFLRTSMYFSKDVYTASHTSGKNFDIVLLGNL